MSSRHQRASGVLLPISALPGKFGIGDCGPSARTFIDWLEKAGQRYWHILPLSIPDSTGSPYASLSSAAGNWLMISPEQLMADGLLSTDWKQGGIPRSSVPYNIVFQRKWQLIRQSWSYFSDHGTAAQRRRFDTFQRQESFWLTDYILFQALKDRHQQQPWWVWEKHYRQPSVARLHIDQHVRRQMQLHAYAQWLWSEQWRGVQTYAHRHGVQIIGDMPFFVRHDSVDVWAHPNLFLLNRQGQPSVVAGVPPDAFAKEGQRWGNPLYDWPTHRRQDFRWWVERFRLLHDRVDMIRFDHFRGLKQTWNIPAKYPTAQHGRWVTSPGRQLLRAVKRHVPHLNLIAEDLGAEGVSGDDLRRAFHAPTIRVVLFGWSGLPHNPHAPDAVSNDVVYYTSNHDTNTTIGWWKEEAKSYERNHLGERVGRVSDVAWQSIAVAAASQAQIAVSTAQDILRLGSTGRFNRPGRRRGNWSWRLRDGQLTPALAKRLFSVTKRYDR